MVSAIKKRRAIPKPGTTTVRVVRRAFSKHTPPKNIKHPNSSNEITPHNNNNHVDYKSSFLAVFPHIMSSYLQLVLNILIISAIGFLLYKFWFVLQHDIDLRAEQYAIGKYVHLA